MRKRELTITQHIQFRRYLLTIIITDGSGGAVARPAVGEAVVAGPAGAARPADDVGLAGTLAAGRVALQLGGTQKVAVARQRAAVILRRDREHRVVAESCREMEKSNLL